MQKRDNTGELPQYYKGLPTDAKTNDRLPMPDVNKSDCETDEN